MSNIEFQLKMFIFQRKITIFSWYIIICLLVFNFYNTFRLWSITNVITLKKSSICKVFFLFNRHSKENNLKKNLCLFGVPRLYSLTFLINATFSSSKLFLSIPACFSWIIKHILLHKSSDFTGKNLMGPERYSLYD